MKKETRVILVDLHDRPTGTMEKMEAHRKGLLHRAFSVFIFNNRGQLMLQRRAKSKYHSGGLWTNTVCSHPAEGEDTLFSARKRLKEEMGFEADLREIFHFVYRAELDGGLIEHELDHVFIGKYDGLPELNPAEADAYDFMYLSEVKRDLENNPGKYTEWFKIIFRESFEILLREAGKMFRNRPLVFEPYYEEKVWGGTRLKELLGKNIPYDHTGESWEISAVPGKESRVKEGFYKDFSVRELWENLHKDFWGIEKKQEDFPLLLKYIDAHDDLSVQVHPGDEMARTKHLSYGKNEMWYILHADKGSRIHLGFKPGMSKDLLPEILQRGQLEKWINPVEVHPGDWFYIPAGTVHAIGKGIVLAEVQQNSDITYRLYDWGRVGLDGKPRPLHIEESLEATDFSATVQKIKNNRLQTAYFDVKLTRPEEFEVQHDRFRIIMHPFANRLIINGREILRGETVLLPASGNFKVSGGRFLEIRL
jgi:isopentenyl-diphosphate delta-isomerase type 1